MSLKELKFHEKSFKFPLLLYSMSSPGIPFISELIKKNATPSHAMSAEFHGKGERTLIFLNKKNK
jgi:hypothetical protein